MDTTHGFPPAAGHITVGKRVYTVHILPTGENAKAAGLRHFGLVGKTGATYFVTDHGPKYHINSVSLGGSSVQRWRPAPRPLPGLTREHLSLFLDDCEAAHV